MLVSLYAIGEIQGSYQIKVSTTALALLLASGHPQLSLIYVQGHILKVYLKGSIGIKILMILLLFLLAV